MGGAHGGPGAVARARQANENAKVILIEKAPLVTWVQASLRYHLSGDEARIKATLEEKEAYFKRRYNIDVRTDTEALALDLDSRVLATKHNGEIERLPFDSLVYAGGAINNKLDVPGLSGPRVTNFRNLNDIKSVKSAIASGAKSVCVVGCGFYGVDAAIGLKEAGLDVVVVESKRRIMPRFSLAFAETILAQLEAMGIEVLLGTTISSAEDKSDQSFSLKLSDGEDINADLVVVCVGTTPRTSLLADAGAALDPGGNIRVDDHMETTLPNVYACGSAVSVPFAIINERRWIPQPAVILRTAHIAGLNAAIDSDQQKESLKPFCGTLITHIGDTYYARTGLHEEEARGYFGDENVLVTTVFGASSEAWVYRQEMCVRLMVEKISRKVLGGEIFGKKGVERRIDLLSVAVLAGFTPEQIVDMDMAYLANSGPAFDPLKDAAMRAKNALDNNTQIMSAEKLALWLKSQEDFRLVDVGETPLLSGRDSTKTLHLPLESLRERISELKSSDSPIVLYSGSGHRSYLAQQALKQLGINNAYHLDGGHATWKMVAMKD